MARVVITDKRAREFRCEEGKQQSFIWSNEVRGLAVRAAKGGVNSWIWQGDRNGKTVRLTLGRVGELTPAQANKMAREALAASTLGIDPREQANEKRQMAAAAAMAPNDLSLLALLNEYHGVLRAAGKPGAQDVASVIKCHVAPYPLVHKSAKDITDDDIVWLCERVKTKPRTSNKIITIAKAAYRQARRKGVHGGNVDFRRFAITSNPAQEIEFMPEGRKADKNPFSPYEMKMHWEACQRVDGLPGVFARLHVLTGGQRIAQLARLRKADIFKDHIRLFDAKGRGQVVREHYIPITAQIAEQLKAFDGLAPEAYCWPGTSGPIDRSTASQTGKLIRAAGGPIGGMKRVRSGVETLLSEAGVSAEIRGYLQSHGIAGVQGKHYDAAKHLEAKAAALAILYKTIGA